MGSGDRVARLLGDRVLDRPVVVRRSLVPLFRSGEGDLDEEDDLPDRRLFLEALSQRLLSWLATAAD